jgi:hypothetical protein
MSSNTVREFVKNILTDKDRCEVIYDAQQFERDGFIGDCELRRITDQFKTMNNIPLDSNVIMWMNLMTTEVYRLYALQHLGIDDNDAKS